MCVCVCLSRLSFLTGSTSVEFVFLCAQMFVYWHSCAHMCAANLFFRPAAQLEELEEETQCEFGRKVPDS